jgi:hypothetical protein
MPESYNIKEHKQRVISLYTSYAFFRLLPFRYFHIMSEGSGFLPAILPESADYSIANSAGWSTLGYS